MEVSEVALAQILTTVPTKKIVKELKEVLAQVVAV